MKQIFKYGIAAATGAAFTEVARWFKLEAEPELVPKWPPMLQCSFCPRGVRTKGTPSGWTVFTTDQGPGKVCCGESICKVQMAQHIARKLTSKEAA